MNDQLVSTTVESEPTASIKSAFDELNPMNMGEDSLASRSAAEADTDMQAVSSNYQLRRLGPYILVTVLLGVYAIVAEYIPLYHRTFFERDPTQSYACDDDQVPSVEAGVYLALVSLSLLCLFLLVPTANNKYAHYCVSLELDKEQGVYDLKRRAWILLWMVIGLMQAVLSQIAIAKTLKARVGRHRPCFFYHCNYQGYQEAYDSGDFTEYDLLTRANAIGDYANCRADDPELHDSQKSFPSGHASGAFSSMVYSMLVIKFMLGEREGLFWSVRGAVAGLPVIFAFWIAVTRVEDYKHHEDDIMAGAILGSLCAYIVWKNIERQVLLQLKTPQRSN